MTEEVKQAFGELEWHDAVLLCINVDRSDPGERDEIVFLIEWADGRRQKVRFFDCYVLDAQMNFGVVAPESIRTASCYSDLPRLEEIRGRWAAMGVDLGDLLCFEVTTNSTASVIRVFARRFDVSNS